MISSTDLKTTVTSIFCDQWEESKGRVIPDPGDLGLGNVARFFADATVLYADLAGSTSLVDNHYWQFSAEIYKAYLRCAARIISDEGGVITAYDGDRVMAIFLGDDKNKKAVRAAMKIAYAVKKVINPALKAQYPDANYLVDHSIGIDTSPIHAASIGVRGDNDLVWVGRAANHAAKLAGKQGYPIWITKEVHDEIEPNVKFDVEKSVSMWHSTSWTEIDNRTVYGTKYFIPF
jgi:class 3 adenylate cyclase